MTWPPDSSTEDIEGLYEEHRTELSEERTQLALQRTLWAAEQTLNAWLRTALTCTVAGLAVFQFVSSSLTWVAPAIATILTITGAGLYVFALNRYVTETRRLKAAGAIVTPAWVVVVIVVPMLVAGCLALLLLVK
jgi:uncharacterized membrane protein YidH (DUF202 family)